MLTNVNNSSATPPSFGDITSDGKITNVEKKSIINWIKSQDTFTPDEKLQLSKFVTDLNKSTTNLGTFLGFIPNKKISPQNLAALESMASNNTFASSLLQGIKSAQAQTNASRTDTSTAGSKPSSNLPTNSLSFPSPNGASHSPASGLSAESQLMPLSNKASYLVNQHSTLNSAQGDCGPTSALMILKANGFDTQETTEDSIRRMRKETPGVKSADSRGSVAISFDQMKSMVEKESVGAIKSEGSKVYPPNNANELVADLKNQLKAGKMPVLLTAQALYDDLPEDKKAFYDKEAYKPGTGHYRVVVGVTENNSILFADPGNGGITSVSIEELQAEMKYRASSRAYNGSKKESRQTEIMTFSRN